MCEASGISANVWFEKVPLLKNVEKYRELGCIAGGTRKNFMSYGHKISLMTQQQREILCDAQTSGGLLVFVKKSGVDTFYEAVREAGLALEPIGESVAKKEHLVEVF